MSSRIFLSFDSSAAERVEPIARHTQELGIRIAGRFTPIGGTLELVPDLRQQLRVADATVVIFGIGPADDQVQDEIEWASELDKGLIGVRIDEEAPTPELLFEAGAEILNWADDDDRARLAGAIRAAKRGAELMERARKQGSGLGASCARPRPPRGTG
jgi:hypothetical protein